MNVTSSYLLNALVFSIFGLVIFGAGFIIVDRLTPYNLWNEIVKERNQALATVVAAITLAIGIIVASAIHG